MDKTRHLDEVILRSPATEQEWKAYYDLRWQILRAPWNQPRGTEKDELESSAWHVAAFTPDKTIIATGRLQRKDEIEGQIRYMCVQDRYRAQGIGRAIINCLEEIARKKRLKLVSLHAREKALSFYEKQGYQLIGESHLLYGSIQHFLMQKRL